MSNEWFDVLDLYRNSEPICETSNIMLVRYDALNRKQLLELDKEDATIVVSIAPVEVTMLLRTKTSLRIYPYHLVGIS